MLSIRMRRTGSKKRPYYRVVVAEGRDPREGAFKDILGTYNPRQKPAVVEVDRERLNQWIHQGARPSDSVRTLIARHLTRDRSAAPAAPVTSEASATNQTPAPAVAAAPDTSAPAAAPQEAPAPAAAAQEMTSEQTESASAPEGATPASDATETGSAERDDNV